MSGKPAPAKAVKATKPKASKASPSQPAASKLASAAKNAPKAPTSKPSKSKEPPPPPQPSNFDRTLRLLTRFERFAWDVAGVVTLALGFMTLLALMLPGLTRGVLLSWWRNLLASWFGWGSVWVALAAGVAGLWMLRRRHAAELRSPSWGRILALEAAVFFTIALLSVSNGISLERAQQGLDGGRVGWGLAELLRILLAPVGLGNPFVLTLLLAVALALSLVAGSGMLGPIAAWARRTGPATMPAGDEISYGPAVIEAPITGLESSPEPAPAPRKKQPFLPPEFRKKLTLQPEEEKAVAGPPQPRDERLPPFDLLSSETASRPDERNINLTAGLIEKTLSEFGIPAKVVGFRVGPTVTQFAVEPGFLEKEKPNSEGEMARLKIRVAQIASLQRDLALALAASRLRIEAPVPGRPYVGIEVPNARSSIVRLRPVLESEAFNKIGPPLGIGLGRDVSGQPVVADLGRMPHLLIAGTTGSGKSICIAALTTCLVMNNTPEDLRLVMIDPKMVELVRFNGLPHLLGKVETELERILAVLRWTVAEMDRRYKLLEASRSRNIDSYNRKARRRKGEEPMPRIVVMIDELADLMMSAPDQTEHNLVRLAQMARATGIHLVVATQRPSTDVVTGLIKANFPARIAFAVASAIDSRVILDTQGADSLLGRGDMLFMAPEASAPVRAQGAMVSDPEIERVIEFWQKSIPPPDEPEPTPWDAMLEEESMQADRDGLVERAIAIVKESQHCSASMLQRRLRIGYPRAARLVDELEELGIVGPSQGGGREREVLVSPDDGEEPGD